MKLKKITAYDIENKLCELFVGIFFLLLASVSATICFFALYCSYKAGTGYFILMSVIILSLFYSPAAALATVWNLIVDLKEKYYD